MLALSSCPWGLFMSQRVQIFSHFEKENYSEEFLRCYKKICFVKVGLMFQYIFLGKTCQ